MIKPIIIKNKGVSYDVNKGGRFEDLTKKQVVHASIHPLSEAEVLSPLTTD